MDLPAELWINSGAVGMLALAVLAIIRGWLVPRSVLEDARKDWQARLAAAEQREANWRAAYLAEHQTVTELTHQNDELLEFGRTGVSVIRALPAAAPATGGAAS